MKTREQLERTFRELGYSDFRWIDPAEIVVAQWVRMKCLFGCPEYGKNGSCPPNVPPVSECERFFREYARVAIFHFSAKFEDPKDRFAWTREVNRGLLGLEKAVFVSGHEKAFVLFMDTCYFCKECAGSRAECRNPKMVRPTPEAMAVDVFATVRKAGYPIEVLDGFDRAMDRFALLLIG